jgi:membrane-bound lytic murein transglycosylase D
VPAALLIVLAALALTPVPVHAASRDVFAVPPALVQDVAFWVRIYSDVPTTAGLIHDDRQLGVVYERLAIPPPEAGPARREAIDSRKAFYADRLQRLADDRKPRDADDRRILALWPKATDAELRAAAERVRFQLGQADRFREGVERAGAWRGWVTDVLAERGLPLEIAALPHVESSYNPYAGSKVGAAGMWQFMKGTGKQFSMRIDGTIDERRDPMRSTEAAADYLSKAYQRLGSWPLAIVSYNHGVNGMARAKAQLGTDDITRVLREYESPTFKFASRNFYPSFLAAVEVEREAARLFPGHTPHESWKTCTVPLRSSASVAQLTKKFSLEPSTLQALNPAVANAVWSGSGKLPSGYSVRVPLDAKPNPALRSLMAWDRARPEAKATPMMHTVAPGETLARIAARYGTTVKAVSALNGVSDPRRLRAGQVLALEAGGGACTAAPARLVAG